MTRTVRLLLRFAALTFAATMLVATVGGRARAADPFVVISVTASGTTTLCDTDCVTCTVGSGECIVVGEEDLVLCTPTSSGLPVTACDWSEFLDGAALNDTAVPGVGALLKQDIAVFDPADLSKTFFGGGP